MDLNYHTITNQGPSPIVITCNDGTRVGLKAGEKITCIPKRVGVVGDHAANFTCNPGHE